MPANPFDQLDPNKLKQPQDPAQTPGINPGNPLDALGGGGPNPPGGLSALGPPQGGGGAAPPNLGGAPDRNQVQPVSGLDQTQPVKPTTPANPMDPNQVWGNLQNQFQTKFKRAMTPEEATALQNYAGYTQGGAINQGMIDKATQGIGSYSGDIKNPWGPAAGGGGGAQPTPGIQTDNLAQQELQKLLLTGNTDAMKLDMNNPAIAAQRQAFDRTNERSRTRERLAAAERGAATNGLGQGGYNADLMAAERGAGDRAANFESQLMTQELAGQRERVMQAMNMAMQSGNQAQARALQEKLSTMDIDLRKRLGTGQLNLGLLQTLMGDQRSKDALGLGYAQLGQQANQGLLNALLGGLG